jgi:hypothetical protein
MSTLTFELSDADDAVIDLLTTQTNAVLPEGSTPLKGNQYLRQTIRGWLNSYKKELGRINSGVILSRVPRGKWTAFMDSADPGVTAFRDLLLGDPVVGRFSESVTDGLAACVTAGVLTRNQADALIA